VRAATQAGSTSHEQAEVGSLFSYPEFRAAFCEKPHWNSNAVVTFTARGKSLRYDNQDTSGVRRSAFASCPLELGVCPNRQTASDSIHCFAALPFLSSPDKTGPPTTLKMRSGALSRTAAVFFSLCATAAISPAGDVQNRISRAVDAAIRPVVSKYGIPGVAVGVTVAGQPYTFSYGVASKETGQPVTRNTLFEIGSVTKTFTATLAAYAQLSDNLSLSDKTSKYLPSLRDHKFGDVTLLHLGTHTPGGLPLQVPDNIRNNDQLLHYFEVWQPAHPPGTYRTYSNPGIGMLGLITAKAMGQDFTALIERRLFPALGMKSSYINVPAAKMADYAQGYTKDDRPIRMTTGVLSSETYGVKTTADDMIRFMEANMNALKLDEKLQHAITDTHAGYFKAGPMTQDLIWEQYPYPVALKTLQEGNSSAMTDNPTPVTEMKPAEAPQENVWINKTGSTNGFGAYVAFVPAKRLGIVILANKNYPSDQKVALGHAILTSLDGGSH
jgi:beta-lactamase class C